MRVIFSLTCLWIISLESCNVIEDCQLNPYIDLAVVRFNLIESPTRVIAFDSITLDGYRIPYDTDTLFLQGLPLNAENNEAQYRYYTDSSMYELLLSYQHEGLIYDVNCDAAIRYYDLDTIHQSFDSLAITANELNINNLINIEVYF